MALQIVQECWPSKVCVTACAKESWRRLFASMVVQASDWNKAQCNPMEQASASTRIYLANRGSTAGIVRWQAIAVKGGVIRVVFSNLVFWDLVWTIRKRSKQ